MTCPPTALPTDWRIDLDEAAELLPLMDIFSLGKVAHISVDFTARGTQERIVYAKLLPDQRPIG